MSTLVRIRICSKMLEASRWESGRMFMRYFDEASHKLAVRGFSVKEIRQLPPMGPTDDYNVAVLGEPFPPSPGWDAEGRECWEWPT